ncbi:aldolase [Rossellomorea aquimaris]|uniref:HPr kinase/phosphorylase n=1 Tax=Rossellomorea aquimaris TaxID=189382 RepID=UPI001CD254F2|nr:aldolase [Rossellomorea aquimaris]MCA1061482.1 aldolase [Rossellomorea aquimaris]
MISACKKTFYRAFGLNIQSEIPLPEVKTINTKGLFNNFDVKIEVGDLREEWKNNGNEGKFTVNNGTVMFHIKNTAIFSVVKGERVIVSPFEHADENKIRLYLLGSCMGIILLQKKILPLHGSAVVIDGKAYAIIGHSGAGKSTLASTLMNSGYKLISDDVIAVSLSENQEFIVHSSYPQQKLWEESLAKLGLPENKYFPLFEREKKYAISVEPSFYEGEWVPLAGIFELEKSEHEQLTIEKVQNSIEKLPVLFHHTFRNSVLNRLGLLEWHFSTTASLADQVEMYRVKRPTSRFTPYEIQSLLLNTLRKGEKKC